MKTSRRPRPAWPLLVLGAAGAAGQPAAAQEIAFENAKIVNPATREITTGAIVVRDGRIATIAAALPTGFGGPRVDLEGRWVIPGLVDAHTHSFGNTGPSGATQFLGAEGTARAALYAGLVAFLDLFSLEDSIFAARGRQRRDGSAGARILAAGPCLTATNGHCSEYGVPTRIVDSPADAEREIDALARRGPDVVKIVYDHASYGPRTMPTVDRATLEAVVATARRHGLKTVVHVGTWDDLRDAVTAGAAAVTHVPGGPMPDDIPALMVERGAVHIPTLAVQGDFARIIDDPAMLDDSLLVAVTSDALRAAYRAVPDTAQAVGAWIAWQRGRVEADRAAVRALAAAGVPMLTGSDAGNYGVFQGYSVHRELELLVAAGLSEWDALRAATTNAAAFLGESWGVSAGDEATFVVLDASPLEDIRNSRRIHAVVQRGVVVDREASMR